MNLILNTNELGYKPFLNSPINTFIVGLKSFCVNQKYSIKINKLINVVKEIKMAEKNIYLSIR